MSKIINKLFWYDGVLQMLSLWGIVIGSTICPKSGTIRTFGRYERSINPETKHFWIRYRSNGNRFEFKTALIDQRKILRQTWSILNSIRIGIWTKQQISFSTRINQVYLQNWYFVLAQNSLPPTTCTKCFTNM